MVAAVDVEPATKPDKDLVSGSCDIRRRGAREVDEEQFAHLGRELDGEQSRVKKRR